jgi:hypothetical protein
MSSSVCEERVPQRRDEQVSNYRTTAGTNVERGSSGRGFHWRLGQRLRSSWPSRLALAFGAQRTRWTTFKNLESASEMVSEPFARRR